MHRRSPVRGVMYRLIKRDGPGWGLRCHPLGGYSALSGDATPEGPRVSGQCPWCPQRGRLQGRHQLAATARAEVTRSRWIAARRAGAALSPRSGRAAEPAGLDRAVEARRMAHRGRVTAPGHAGAVGATGDAPAAPNKMAARRAASSNPRRSQSLFRDPQPPGRPSLQVTSTMAGLSAGGLSRHLLAS